MATNYDFMKHSAEQQNYYDTYWDTFNLDEVIKVARQGYE